MLVRPDAARCPRSSAQPPDAELDLARPRVPPPGPVAVAMRRTILRATLPDLGAHELGHLRLHQPLRDPAHRLAHPRAARARAAGRRPSATRSSCSTGAGPTRCEPRLAREAEHLASSGTRTSGGRPRRASASILVGCSAVPDRFRQLETRLDGPLLIEPAALGDERGFFCETYRRSGSPSWAIPEEIVQDNHSRSRRGVVRGMHFQVGAGGQARALRAREDLRRRRRPAQGLADLRRVGGGRALRREHARAVRAGRLRARVLRAQRRRRRALQAGRLLRRRSSGGSPGTTPTSPSKWPLPLAELIVPSATPRRRPCARSPTSCRSPTSAERVPPGDVPPWGPIDQSVDGESHAATPRRPAGPSPSRASIARRCAPPAARRARSWRGWCWPAGWSA